jgi:hypothetical protein
MVEDLIPSDQIKSLQAMAKAPGTRCFGDHFTKGTLVSASMPIGNIDA